MTANKKGFTLIELLIVVAIIGILASVVLVGLGPSRIAARDARRVGDLRQVQTALELYSNANGSYCSTDSAVVGDCDSAAVAPATVMEAQYTALEEEVAAVGVTALPHDPSVDQGHIDYGYTSNGTGYTLVALLEGNPPSGYEIPTATAAEMSDVYGAGALDCAAVVGTPGQYCVVF